MDNVNMADIQEAERYKSDSAEEESWSEQGSKKRDDGQNYDSPDRESMFDDDLQEHEEIHAEKDSSSSQTSKQIFKDASESDDHIKTQEKGGAIDAGEGLNKSAVGRGKQTFTDMAELEDHIRMHKKGELICTYCDLALESKSKLIEHMQKEHTVEEIYSCALCEVIFDRYSDLAIHSKFNHSFEGYRCGICGKFYQIQSELQKHEDQHSSGPMRKLFKCIFCDDSFIDTRRLSQHSRQVHRSSGFECSVCKLFFQVNVEFEKHRNTHFSEELTMFPEPGVWESSQNLVTANPVQTKLADAAQSTTSQREEQEVEEVEVEVEVEVKEEESLDEEQGKPLKCVLCNEVFKLNVNLSAHSKNVHILVGYKCEICHTFFQIESEFRDHESTHTELESSISLSRMGLEGGIDQSKDELLQVEPNGLSLSCDNENDDLITTTMPEPESECLPIAADTKEEPCEMTSRNDMPSQSQANVEKDQDQYGHFGKIDQDETSCSSSSTIEYNPEDFSGVRNDENSSSERTIIFDLQSDVVSLETRSKLKVKEKIGPDSENDWTSTANIEMGQAGSIEWLNTNSEKIASTEEISEEKLDDGSEFEESSVKTCDQTLETGHALSNSRQAVSHSVKCILCDAIFEKEDTLMDHLRDVHSYMGFTCRICRKYFVTEIEMQRHEAAHSVPLCYLCDKLCESAEDLDEHMQEHENSPRIYCLENNCEKEFLTKSKLKQHIMDFHALERQKVPRGGEDEIAQEDIPKSSESSALVSHCTEQSGTDQDLPVSLGVLGRHGSNIDYPHKCQYCDKGFDTESDKEFHEMMHTRDFKCSTCSKDFESLEELQDHVYVVHKGRQIDRTHMTKPKHFKCIKCEKLFFYKYQFINHLKTHETPNICKYCGKSYKFKMPLLHHEQCHLTKVIYMCQYCKKNFVSESRKSCHEKKCGRPKRHVCNYCNECFKSDYQKESHEIKKHTGKYKICDICGKKLSSTPSFKVHMKHHKEPSNYKCEICGKDFPYQPSYKQHLILVHTEARPFTCSFCGQGFKILKNLRNHENVHKGITVKCRICGDEFKNLHHRTKHMQDAHTGRKYICQVCGKAFTGRSPLEEHERIHTGEKPFKCPHCDACFNRKHHVTQHLKRHYKGTA